MLNKKLLDMFWCEWGASLEVMAMNFKLLKYLK